MATKEVGNSEGRKVTEFSGKILRTDAVYIISIEKQIVANISTGHKKQEETERKMDRQCKRGSTSNRK